jgi:hypothetical protein
MKKDNVGFEYDFEKDNKEWDNVVKIAFDNNCNEEVRHQAFTLLRIRNIVQDGIEANGIFSGIKWDKEKGQIIESESAIKDTGIGVNNILGGHSGRIYFSMPKDSTVTKEREGISVWVTKQSSEKYNDLLLDIVANTKNAKNKFSNLGNIKGQTGLLGRLVSVFSSLSSHTYDAKDVKLNGLYSRLAATHGVKEIDGRASEAKLESMKEAMNASRKIITVKSSQHFGIDFVSYDENNALVSDGNRGHMYINSTYTDNYSAFGIGLEGFAPGKGSHDTSGNADLYSAFGGPKYYIKVKKDDENFEEYIKNYCKHAYPNLIDEELELKINGIKTKALNVQQLTLQDSDIKKAEKYKSKILEAIKEIKDCDVTINDSKHGSVHGVNILKFSNGEVNVTYDDSDNIRIDNISDGELQKKIEALSKKVVKKEVQTKKEFEHIAIEVVGKEQINIVKSKDDSTYYIVSELAKKRLMNGDTLPKYHDGMRVVIDENNHKEFLTNIEKRRGDVEKYAMIEKKVISEFDIKSDPCLKDIDQEYLKKFLQEALCSKKDTIKDLLNELNNKIDQVEEIDKPSSMNGNNNRKIELYKVMQKSEKNNTYVDRHSNKSKRPKETGVNKL